MDLEANERKFRAIMARLHWRPVAIVIHCPTCGRETRSNLVGVSWCPAEPVKHNVYLRGSNAD